MKFLKGFLICVSLFCVNLQAQEGDILSILESNYENGTSKDILPISDNVIALNVNSADFWYLKALCEDQVGDYLSARNSLIKSKVNGYYKKSVLYFHLARTELNLNNKEAALAYVEKALQRNAKPEMFRSEAFSGLSDSVPFMKLLDLYRPKLNGWTGFFFFIALQGILLFLILFFRKKGNTKANRNLGLFVLSFSFILLFYVGYKSRFLYEYPLIYFRKLWIPIMFALGPLLLFYVKDLFKIKYSLKFKLAHLGLFLIGFAFYASFHLLDPANQIYNVAMDILWYEWVKNAQMLIYLILIYKLVKKAKDHVGANVVKWLNYMMYAYAGFVLSFVLYSTLNNFDFFYRDGWDYVICLIISASIILIGVFGLVQPQIFWGFNVVGAFTAIKYEKSGLIPSLAAELKQKLIELMVDEKVYKNNNLNLDQLSEILGTTKHNTSQIINEHFNENFFDFLNDFRIAEAKELLLNEEQKMTVSEILYEVGFNNKVTFNSAFKKRTGITPTQYRVQASQVRAV
ncbi:AraC family transcriptional regulator [uncultured Psychroserpens sp.]|uniref:helix-turn-helix domain-containing protein n=1 Tax=uncultured Psychroserpens sp. TaxID=255436 RepID=UPI00260969E0|nr:AraC family transcriptional regulator [uncultured Psychroserpens sp.]